VILCIFEFVISSSFTRYRTFNPMTKPCGSEPSDTEYRYENRAKCE